LLCRGRGKGWEGGLISEGKKERNRESEREREISIQSLSVAVGPLNPLSESCTSEPLLGKREEGEKEKERE
jgi:hypothetical protein